jgi:hypothetical protein
VAAELEKTRSLLIDVVEVEEKKEPNAGNGN